MISKGSNVHPNMVCAGWPEGDVNACKGDSGSPLYVPKSPSDNSAIIIGITSWVLNPCNSNPTKGYKSEIGAYTRVANIVNWIKSNMKGGKSG